MILFERRLVEILLARDPEQALRAAAADRGLPASVRKAFAGASADGVRMAALLVARLRFERLMRGCPEAAQAFEAEPGKFATSFRRYHAEVPPTAFFPAAEASLFRAWVSAAASPTPRASPRPSPWPGPRRSARAAAPSPSAPDRRADRPPRAR